MNNAITEVEGIVGKPFPRRFLENISCLVLHRIRVDQAGYANTVEGLAKFFSRHPEGIAATGGQFPYHFIVDEVGQVSQCVRILDIAPGAKALNRPGIQIAFIGDFRKAAPTPAQWESGMQLACKLYPYAALVTGHTEDHSKNTTVDKDKDCPGKMFDLGKFRRELHLRTAAQTVRALGEFGLVL